jgi:hypothetical protein
MTSFLVSKREKKTFDEKISKLAVKTQQNIRASINSFSRFCQEKYNGRNSDDIFNELKTLEKSEQVEAIKDLLQYF